MADILQFPSKPRIQESTVISLYTDEEINVTVAAINLHGPYKITPEELGTMDAESVERCLLAASVNELLSSRARRLANHIIGTIERVRNYK